MWSTDSPESGEDLIELTSVYRDGQDMQRKSPKVISKGRQSAIVVNKLSTRLNTDIVLIGFL